MKDTITKWHVDIREEMYNKIAANTDSSVELLVPCLSNPEKEFHQINFGDIIQYRLVDGESGKVVFGTPVIAFQVTRNTEYMSIDAALEKEDVNNIARFDTVYDAQKHFTSMPDLNERIANYGVHAIGLGKRLTDIPSKASPCQLYDQDN